MHIHKYTLIHTCLHIQVCQHISIYNTYIYTFTYTCRRVILPGGNRRDFEKIQQDIYDDSPPHSPTLTVLFVDTIEQLIQVVFGAHNHTHTHTHPSAPPSLPNTHTHTNTHNNPSSASHMLCDVNEGGGKGEEVGVGVG
ncbi:hypothetical protein EON63_23930, partial [archaeon]